ncbi:MAG TPA: spermidine synthase, partial [Micromonosporaceae bacterium]|nr:spermidine synthase [Micromonosporaceae bacterium]
LAGEQGDNFVIVASDAALPVDRLRTALAASAEEPVEVLAGRALDDFVGTARVLTDDFAPVDQLLATL